MNACECCYVPIDVGRDYCAGCRQAHGAKLPPRVQGEPQCERYRAWSKGYAERIAGLPEPERIPADRLDKYIGYEPVGPLGLGRD